MDQIFTIIGVVIIVMIVAGAVSDQRAKEERRRESRERDRQRDEMDRIAIRRASERGHDLGPTYYSWGSPTYERYCQREGCGAEAWHSSVPLSGHLYGGRAVAYDCPHPSPGRSADMRPLDPRTESPPSTDKRM